MTSQANRPNILWLDTEDLSPDLGCYGHPQVHTPHLDRLAEQGALYEQAFVTAPVCSASRSAIATGTYQTSIGCHNHRDMSRYREEHTSHLPDGIRVFTDQLREAGYFTCCGDAMEPSREGKLDYNFEMDFEDIFDGTDWSRRDPGQPFFAEMHFPEVHRVFQHDTERPIDPDDVEFPPYYPDHEVTRLDWALYLETIQILDRKVGQILQRLEDEGLVENTVVFFTGDHGRPMLRAKQWLYDSGIQIPLIVRWPGNLEAGTIRHDLVSAIDLTATWLDIAGAEIPPYVRGRSLFNGQPRDRIFAARDRCDEADFRIRCVRDDRYKYIRNFYPERPFLQFNGYKKRQYPVLTLMQVLHERGELEPAQEALMAPYRSPEELYDLQTDPHEINNLAEDPAHADVLRQMREKLDTWTCETADMGRIPEHPRDTRWVDDRQRERFAGNMEARGLSADIADEDYLKWWIDHLREMRN